jgi:SAM-dependent methyltransferase
MIIHKLIATHLKAHEASESFYWLQAEEAIRWISRQGAPVGPGVAAVDLGCGHGIFGACLQKRGCDVTFSDEANFLMPALKDQKFIAFNLEAEPLQNLGRFDLVICSNVLEHLSNPERLIATIQDSLKPSGYFFLSWTNWLSPWGGHEFSPFHFFGPRAGTKLFDKFVGRKRVHTPYENLFPTYIGQVLKQVKNNRNIDLISIAPRYYTEFSIITRLPVIREFLTWNCALLLQRRDRPNGTVQ